MLMCAHKELLLQLARQHARDLRGSLTLARCTLGPFHVNVQAIEQRLAIADDAVRTLTTEPVKVAA